MIRPRLLYALQRDVGVRRAQRGTPLVVSFYERHRCGYRHPPVPLSTSRQHPRAFCAPRNASPAPESAQQQSKGEQKASIDGALADQPEPEGDDSSPKEQMVFESGPIGTINKSIYDQPIETLAGVVSMEMATIYGLHAMLKCSGVEVPADLAVAFILSRPLRRIRLPLELAVANVLARVTPALTRIHVMQIFRSFPMYRGKTADGAMQKGVAKLTSAIDKFGAAYTVGSRVTGVCIIVCIYAGLRNGVDVSRLLQTYGFTGAEKTGAMLSTWAGAVLLSSVLFPVNAYMGARIAPYYKRIRKAVTP